jgi:peptidoglycan/xylan/chitin deacetylase (PgdA/CDA1 family)
MTASVRRALQVLGVAILLLTGCFGQATPSGTPTSSASATARLSATPSRSELPVPTATATPSVTPPTPSPTPEAIAYTVQPGDSLTSIAARYATTWQSLVYWNRDRYPALDPAAPAYNPSQIGVGWQLTVRPGVVVAYDPPLPTPTGPPATPTPPSGSSSVALFHGDRSTRAVALTFDMGGRTEPAVQIVTWLRDHGVPATIFVTGSSVDNTAAGRAVVSIINARPDLFDLGNHSYGHPDLSTRSAAAVADELRRAETAIARYADQSPRPLFRPPYGAWDAEVLAGAGAVGYRWSVLWDVDTIDWKPVRDGGPTADTIVARVLSGAQGGSIVQMPLGGYETLQALPDVVAGLRARGFSLVTLGQLVGS